MKIYLLVECETIGIYKNEADAEIAMDENISAFPEVSFKIIEQNIDDNDYEILKNNKQIYG